MSGQSMLSRAVVQRLRSAFTPARYLKHRRAVATAAATTSSTDMDAVITAHKVIIVGGGPAGTIGALSDSLLSFLVVLWSYHATE